MMDMHRSSFADMECSIARSLEVIGEWWSLLIVRDAFFGVTRFGEFQRRLGIARNVLSARLDRLVAEGVLHRREYDETRGRCDYLLTAKGLALWPVIITLEQWGDEWIVGTGHEAVVLTHRTCGERTLAEVTCSHCREPLHGLDVHLHPGPGLSDPSFLRLS